MISLASTTRGIFRIPGSHSTINALYDHYASQVDDGEVISGTVRCSTLPERIQCNVHDVASAFKKFLAGLPGGILGSAWLLDAFSSIHAQLEVTAEWTRTKQSKVRSRLIALAIGTVSPRYQRELICAVLGLLSMIGRAAETARREDDHGRPLPTSDLMGYSALGIVFGPLLVGDLLETHNLGAMSPPTIPDKSSRKASPGKHKKSKSVNDANSLKEYTDKIRMVNSITEMLITHWRDVVRHMKSLGALKSMEGEPGFIIRKARPKLRLSASESFAIRKMPDWGFENEFTSQIDSSKSPTPTSRESHLLRAFDIVIATDR